MIAKTGIRGKVPRPPAFNTPVVFYMWAVSATTSSPVFPCFCGSQYHQTARLVVGWWYAQVRCGAGVMARKTSISLSDEDDVLLHDALAAGTPLREIIVRGLHAEDPAGKLARDAAAEALDAVREELREMIDGAVKRALAEAQGGSW